MSEVVFKEARALSIRAVTIKFAASLLFKVTLTFGLIFNLSFSVAPSLSTGRLVLLIMIILYGRDAFTLTVKLARQHSIVFTVFLLLLPFSMIWISINGANDTVILSRAFWFFLFSILGAMLYVRMCRFNLFAAMQLYLLAMVAQSFFVFQTVVDPGFRDWVGNAIVIGGNIDFTEGVRFSGLSNGAGAALSVQLGLGVIAALVLFSQSRSLTGRFWLTISALLITASTVFVGRTGLYIALLTLLGFVLLSRRSILIPIMLLMTVWGASSFIYSFDSSRFQLENNEIKLDRTVNWAFDIFLFGESESSNALISDLSKTRDLDIDTMFFGSGRVTEPDGSNYSGHDSGYIHSLYALGLPLSVIFYISLFWLYWRLLFPVQGRLKLIGLMLMSLVFMLEVKEPLIFKYTLPFFVFVYCYLARHKQMEKLR